MGIKSMRSFAVAGGCAVLALFVMSCSKTDKQAPPQISPGGPGQIGSHWVQDERLRAVMAEISRHAARWPAGVPDEPEAASGELTSTFRDAEALADGLARAARDIPRAVADREMTPEIRTGFNAEARRLRDQAIQLKDAARGRKVERMQRLLDGISSSCISCHSQYRDFTGELGARRASVD